MSFTGVLGTSDSMPGNIVPGITGGATYTESLSDSLTFSETLSSVRVYHLQDALVFSESLQPNRVFTRSLDDTLTFTDSTIGSQHNFYARLLTDTLTFTETTSSTTIHDIKDTLSFSESIHTNHVFVRSLADTLTLAETISSTTIHHLHDTLSFSESLAINHTYRQPLTDTLTFSETISPAVIHHLQDTLSFSESLIIGHGPTRSLIDTLTFAETLTHRKVHVDTLHDSLTFTPTIQPHRTVNLTLRDRLTFLDTPKRSTTYIRSVSDTLDFDQPILRYLNYDTILNIPNPLSVVIPGNVPRPLGYMTRYGDAPPIILRNTIPNVLFTGQGYAVTLKPPIWDDSETGVNAVSIKRAMNKSSRSYVKSSHRFHLKYSFDVSRQQAYALEEFVYRTSGKPVVLHNWKYEIYQGYITTNPLTITQRRSYANIIDVEFDGIRLM